MRRGEKEKRHQAADLLIPKRGICRFVVAMQLCVRVCFCISFLRRKVSGWSVEGGVAI